MAAQDTTLEIKIVTGILRTIASRRTLITYGEVLQLAGLIPNDPLKLKELRGMLYKISNAENKKGHPLLSVVVVNQVTGKCGDGFYKMAKECGAQSNVEDAEFFISELNAVHKFWSSSKAKVAIA
jgi:hypothetical protein